MNQDRNIAAMLSTDAITVHVQFINSESAKVYTYVALRHQNLAVGDYVVVQASQRWQVARVTQVDNDLLIDPADNVEYAWVAQRVDVESYDARMQTNNQIKEVVRTSYRTNARRQMADLLLAALPGDAKAQVTTLLGTAAPAAPAAPASDAS